MSVMIAVSEQIAEHLNQLPLMGNRADPDSKVRALLEAEYQRQLSHYRRIDRQLSEKYGLTFEEFQRQQIVKQRGYNWDVESDAGEWAFALSGIRTARRKLTELLSKAPDNNRSVLVSACLLGELVRYDGGHKRCDHPILRRWCDEGRVVSFCPEVAGGLSVPRPPAEIKGAGGGLSVLAGYATVVDSTGRDVSMQFIAGAWLALKQARAMGIRVAVLKDGSPSCGSTFIYDGTFTGTKVSGLGVTAALLQHAGVHIFSEDQLSKADSVLMGCSKTPVWPNPGMQQIRYARYARR